MNCATPDCDYRAEPQEDYCLHCRYVMEHERAVREVERSVFADLWRDEAPQDRLEAA